MLFLTQNVNNLFSKDLLIIIINVEHNDLNIKINAI